MQGLLLEPAVDTGNPPPAVPSLAQLHLDLAAWRAEMAGLRRENLERRQQAGYWKGMPAQACRRLTELEQEHEHLRGENRQLQAQAFGRQSEQPSGRDRSNQLDDPSVAKPTRPRGHQPGRPGPQRRD